ncbi:MAG TPA: cyclase family protein [Anaerolineales bacterium]|nr:cyclase family protein [Anaerolineales bacterium]
MQVIDISIPISPDMPVWPGDPRVELVRTAKIAEGANANVSRLTCGVHIGTHVDAPVHFIDGAASVESLSLDRLIGKAFVAELEDINVIDDQVLDSADLPTEVRRLLIKTQNSAFWSESPGLFREDFVAIDARGAKWLTDRDIQTVGVDYLSVAPFGDSFDTHNILLQEGVVIIEGLNLFGVDPGWYSLYCLPLKLVGSDGAPARAVLLQEE